MSVEQQQTTTCLFAAIGSRTARGGQVTRVTTKAECLPRIDNNASADDTAYWGGEPLALRVRGTE